ncbi:MAG: glycosyltransferase family 4 protein [Rhodothermales bacterium]
MKKVLLVANWDWVLYNFRFALAKILKEQGYEVAIVCPHGKYVDRMQAAGFRWIDWPLKRRSLNPFGELQVVQHLAKIYKAENPSYIHHDTIKPNLYGSMAVRLNRWKYASFNPSVVNTFMGLGYLFSNHQKATFLRRLLLPVIRTALKQPNLHTVFSNNQDRETFVSLKLLPREKTQVLVSECVDTDTFHPVVQAEATPTRPFRVLMAARLLWDKGVQEFVDAASILKKKGESVEFWIAGLPDKENPQWVPEEMLKKWEDDHLIQWLGHRSDMPQLLQQVDIATLPTHYNEGLPRFLVESASSGLPLIATNIPACEAIVRDGINGIIIPRRNANALAEAIHELLNNSDMRKDMGQASRDIATQEFNEKIVLKDWLKLYSQLSPEHVGESFRV